MKECSKVRLDQGSGPLAKIPAANQGDTLLCSHYTATQLLDAWRGSSSASALVSPMHAAALYHKENDFLDKMNQLEEIRPYYNAATFAVDQKAAQDYFSGAEDRDVLDSGLSGGKLAALYWPSKIMDGFAILQAILAKIDSMSFSFFVKISCA